MSARLLLAMAIIAAVVGSAGCELGGSAAPDSDVDEKPRAVRVIFAEQGSMADTLTYVGTVQPQREVQVLSRVAATVVEVYVDEGDPVSSTTPLLEMKSMEIDAQVERLDAEVERARREHDYLCQVAETDRTLAELGSAPAAAADASESKCRVSEQGLVAARAARKEAGERQEYLEEFGPFDGVVLQRMVENGEHITPGRPLFSVGTTEQEIRVMATEGDVAAGIEVGQPVLVHTATETVRSQVTQLAMVASRPGRTVEVRIDLPGPLEENMRAGMSADVDFVFAESQETTMVAAEAVLETETGAVIFVVDDGVLRKVEIKTGIRTAEHVEILSPLSSDLPVVIGQLQALRDGEVVYAVEASMRERR